ncbi:MAG: hypothetical protein ABSF95_23165 [Verrucomicrobiota bacterium]|jgi:hypothetical protein
MNWKNEPATEGQPGHPERLGHEPHQPLTQAKPVSGKPPAITIGKAFVLAEEKGKEVEIEVFTMTLGADTMQLLPLRTWAQLDVHKWTVQGKLPGTPAGLEVTFDHVKILGETVSAKDPDACSKLETIFNQWLALEKDTLELARKKAHPKPSPATPETARQPEQQALHFQVELDKRGQAHIKCLQGKEEAATIGLNPPGFNDLFNQGLMRKPHSLNVGVLHNWVELDGALFSFERGNNDSSKLEKALNERYLPEAALGRGKDVVIFANAASSTGFDIQFPVRLAGVLENRRRPLNEDSLALLQDSNACGLLHKEIVIKVTRPSLVFKQKTPDGGERYLQRTPENTVTLTDDRGGQKVIDLSQPVNYLRLTAVEFTAVFNHPAINQHSKLKSPANGLGQGLPRPDFPKPLPPPPPPPPLPAPAGDRTDSSLTEVQGPVSGSPAAAASAAAEAAAPALATMEKPGTAPSLKPVDKLKPLPNLWLEEILARQPIRHDWFACLAYSKMAARFGNSREGKFGLSACWAVALGETEEIAEPAFKGIFLTEKGGLGFLNQGHVARFNKGVAFIGTQESALEGIDVSLVGVGLDVQQRIVFIITDNYRAKFGVPDQTLTQALVRLAEYGALIMSVQETLQSPEPLEVVWTVPAEQAIPGDPQALESTRPA